MKYEIYRKGKWYDIYFVSEKGNKKFISSAKTLFQAERLVKKYTRWSGRGELVKTVGI